MLRPPSEVFSFYVDNNYVRIPSNCVRFLNNCVRFIFNSVRENSNFLIKTINVFFVMNNRGPARAGLSCSFLFL